MKYGVLLTLLLTACAGETPPPQTVTITKTVNVVPPADLYSLASGCKHGDERTDGTVRDLANALIDERQAVDVCLGDRAALRNWANDAK
jgi:hypothetical protein